jgi:hypothetical protein
MIYLTHISWIYPVCPGNLILVHNYFHTLPTLLIFSSAFYFRMVLVSCYMTLMAG